MGLRRRRKRAVSRRPAAARLRLSGRAASIAVALLLCTGAAWALPILATAVRDHPYFAVREITVRGTRTLDSGAILAAANLRLGVSIWRVSPNEAREGIESLAWVRRAMVRREFPNRLVVALSERRPAAITVADSMQYVDRGGRALGPVRSEGPVDLPFITGLDALKQPAATAAAIRRALRLARLCERRSCAGGISEVHLDPERGLVLVPESFPVPVVMGWGGWRHKLDRMERVFAAWEGRETRIAAVDVTLRRSVIVKLRDKQKPAPAKGATRGMPI